MGWNFCTYENDTCTFSGLRRVRFGVAGKWVYKDLGSESFAVGIMNIPCTVTAFDSDPAAFIFKHCDVSQSAPTGVTLNSFSAKATNKKGVKLKWQTANELDVVGFRVWGVKKATAKKVPD